jgi:hypothetical protein
VENRDTSKHLNSEQDRLLQKRIFQDKMATEEILVYMDTPCLMPGILYCELYASDILLH